MFGKLGNRHASSLVSIAIALLVVCLLLLLPAADSEAHLAILSIFWGIAIMVIGLGMQVKVLALAPTRPMSQWRYFQASLILVLALARW